MQIKPNIVILGTGGTIAGTAASASDTIGYTAAQLSVEQLVAAVPALKAWPLHTEQVAQVDSKDMSFEIWRTLAERVQHWLKQPEVSGIVVTHGTDTLEETAYFLHRVLAPAKPVVLTAAMRPATALAADGPQNILDAVRVAAHPDARGVVTVTSGSIHSALDVRKAHTYRINTFSSGDAGPIGYVEAGQVRTLRPWPTGEALGLSRLEQTAVNRWPRVEIVMSYTGASGAIVEALTAQGVQGIVVAGTGSGTVHCELEIALRKAQQAGVTVVRASRCAEGPVFAKPGDVFPSSELLSPVKARVELMLVLLRAA